MKIRKVTLNDAASICNIYNHYIENTAVSFETEPVSIEKMRQRIDDVTNSGFPYYVGEINDKVVGYYYIHHWHERRAFSSTVEVSIYLDSRQTGKGLGTVLFEHLLRNIDRERIHVLMAAICVPNEGSVKLHEKFGFKQVSLMKEVGWKFDQWRDIGHWMLTFDNPCKHI